MTISFIILCQLFSECVLHFHLFILMLLNLLLNGQLILHQLFLLPVNGFLLLTGGCSLTHIICCGVLELLQLSRFLVSCVVDLVHVWLLNEDLIAEPHDRMIIPILHKQATSWISLFDFIYDQTCILTCSEELSIIIIESHLHDWLSMSLHLVELLNLISLIVGELPELHFPCVPILTNTTKEDLSSC